MKTKRILTVLLGVLTIATASTFLVSASNEPIDSEQQTRAEQVQEIWKEVQERYTPSESARLEQTKQKKIHDYYVQKADRGYRKAVALVQEYGDFTEGVDQTLLKDNGDYYMSFVISLCHAYNKYKGELSQEDSVIIDEYLDNSYETIKGINEKTENSQAALDLIATTIIPSYPVKEHMQEDLDYTAVIQERRAKQNEYAPGKALEETIAAEVVARGSGYYKDGVDYDLLETDENYYLDFVTSVCDAYTKANMTTNVTKTIENFLHHSYETITTKFEKTEKLQTTVNLVAKTITLGNPNQNA